MKKGFIVIVVAVFVIRFGFMLWDVQETGSQRSEAVSQLLKTLDNNTASDMEKILAVRSIAEIHRTDYLDMDSYQARQEIPLRKTYGVETLISNLPKTKGYLQAEIAAAIGEVQEKKAVGALVNVINSHVKDVEAEGNFLRRLGNNEGYQQAEIDDALGKSQADASLHALVKVIRNINAGEEKKTGVQELNKDKVNEIASTIEKMKVDQTIVQNCLNALVQIGTDESTKAYCDIYEKHSGLFLEIMFDKALNCLKPYHVNAWRKRLADPNPASQLIAARAFRKSEGTDFLLLTKWGYPEINRAIMKQLQDKTQRANAVLIAEQAFTLAKLDPDAADNKAHADVFVEILKSYKIGGPNFKGVDRDSLLPVQAALLGLSTYGVPGKYSQDQDLTNALNAILDMSQNDDYSGSVLSADVPLAVKYAILKMHENNCTEKTEIVTQLVNLDLRHLTMAVIAKLDREKEVQRIKSCATKLVQNLRKDLELNKTSAEISGSIKNLEAEKIDSPLPKVMEKPNQDNEIRKLYIANTINVLSQLALPECSDGFLEIIQRANNGESIETAWIEKAVSACGEINFQKPAEKGSEPLVKVSVEIGINTGSQSGTNARQESATAPVAAANDPAKNELLQKLYKQMEKIDLAKPLEVMKLIGICDALGKIADPASFENLKKQFDRPVPDAKDKTFKSVLDIKCSAAKAITKLHYENTNTIADFIDNNLIKELKDEKLDESLYLAYIDALANNWYYDVRLNTKVDPKTLEAGNIKCVMEVFNAYAKAEYEYSVKLKEFDRTYVIQNPYGSVLGTAISTLKERASGGMLPELLEIYGQSDNQTKVFLLSIFKSVKFENLPAIDQKSDLLGKLILEKLRNALTEKYTKVLEKAPDNNTPATDKPNGSETEKAGMADLKVSQSASTSNDSKDNKKEVDPLDDINTLIGFVGSYGNPAPEYLGILQKAYNPETVQGANTDGLPGQKLAALKALAQFGNKYSDMFRSVIRDEKAESDLVKFAISQLASFGEQSDVQLVMDLMRKNQKKYQDDALLIVKNILGKPSDNPADPSAQVPANLMPKDAPVYLPNGLPAPGDTSIFNRALNPADKDLLNTVRQYGKYGRSVTTIPATLMALLFSKELAENDLDVDIQYEIVAALRLTLNNIDKQSLRAFVEYTAKLNSEAKTKNEELKKFSDKADKLKWSLLATKDRNLLLIAIQQLADGKNISEIQKRMVAKVPRLLGVRDKIGAKRDPMFDPSWKMLSGVLENNSSTDAMRAEAIASMCAIQPTKVADIIQNRLAKSDIGSQEIVGALDAIIRDKISGRTLGVELVKLLNKPHSMRVRAIESIAQVRDDNKEHIAQLLALVGDELENPIVKRYAITALGKIDKNVVLFGSGDGVNNGFLNYIANTRETAMASRAVLVSTKFKSSGVLRTLTDILDKKETSEQLKIAICKFFADLKDSDMTNLSIVMGASVRTNGKITVTGGLGGLALNSESGAVRLAAVNALGAIKSIKSLDALEGVIANEKDYFIRRQAVAIIGNIPNDRVFTILETYLQQDNVSVPVRRELLSLGLLENFTDGESAAEASWKKIAEQRKGLLAQFLAKRSESTAKATTTTEKQ